MKKASYNGKGAPTLDDLRKTIPKGGLMNEGLRKGYGKNFSIEGLHKDMYSKK